jgi:hypothetical protein
MFGYVKENLLKSAIAENEKLLDAIKEQELENKKIGDNLASIESQYFDVINSEQYKANSVIKDLKVSILILEDELRTKRISLLEIKEKGLSKINYELDQEVHQLKIQAKTEVDNSISEMLRMKEKLRSEIDGIESTLLDRGKALQIVNEELHDAQAILCKALDDIEIQEVINTVTPINHELSVGSSSDIKQEIIINKDQQKSAIKDRVAWTAFNHYLYNNSLTDGKAQQKRLGNFLLSAFNAQVDNLIGSSRRSNMLTLHKKIEQWFEKINKVGEDHFVVIERSFLMLRLTELRLITKHHVLVEMEKEEERYINERIREEAIVQKEINSFVEKKSKEEKKYLEEIRDIDNKIKFESGSRVLELENTVSLLKQKIEQIQMEKERALSLAQITRSGHVYVISNKGSFGHDVFKIGMTRRLDPMDRIRELGDASVPFYFDVHGIIHSEDAPTLERELHKRFNDRRVNKDNYRREFFRVTIEDIEKVVREIHGEISFAI